MLVRNPMHVQIPFRRLLLEVKVIGDYLAPIHAALRIEALPDRLERLDNVCFGFVHLLVVLV